MLQDTNIGTIDQEVANPDPWFPGLNLKDFQELYRIPGHAPRTLERQVLIAMADCNTRLAVWRSEREAQGVDALPDEQRLDYEEAVFARAYAELIPLLPSVVTDERAREEIAGLKQHPSEFIGKCDARLARIVGLEGGRRRLRSAVI